MKSSFSLKDRIVADMKWAMKSKQASTLQALKLVYAECRNKEIELKTDLDNVQMVSILKKQVKQYEESIEQYERAGRLNSAQEQAGRLKLIKSYLPKALSAEELKVLVGEVIADLKATSIKEMGLVIKTVQSRTEGSADNRQLVALVKERLQAI